MSERIVLEFTPDAVAGMDQLKQDTNAENYAAVVRSALRLYMWLLDVQNQGFDVGVVKNGQLVKVMGFLL